MKFTLKLLALSQVFWILTPLMGASPKKHSPARVALHATMQRNITVRNAKKGHSTCKRHAKKRAVITGYTRCMGKKAQPRAHCKSGSCHHVRAKARSGNHAGRPLSVKHYSGVGHINPRIVSGHVAAPAQPAPAPQPQAIQPNATTQLAQGGQPNTTTQSTGAGQYNMAPAANGASIMPAVPANAMQPNGTTLQVPALQAAQVAPNAAAQAALFPYAQAAIPQAAAPVIPVVPVPAPSIAVPNASDPVVIPPDHECPAFHEPAPVAQHAAAPAPFSAAPAVSDPVIIPPDHECPAAHEPAPAAQPAVVPVPLAAAAAASHPVVIPPDHECPAFHEPGIVDGQCTTVGHTVTESRRLACGGTHCLECLQEIVRLAARDQNKHELRCPTKSCSKNFTADDIAKITDDPQLRASLLRLQEQGIAAVIKECPQCKTLIEKTGGCDAIRCPNKNCDYQFCWKCLGAHNYNTGCSCPRPT